MRQAEGAGAFARKFDDDGELLLQPDTARVALDEIKAAAMSGDAEARGRAMQALLVLVRHDPDAHQEAISIFKGALDHEHTPLAAISAARGIAHILGPAEGRRAWEQLLDHPREELAVAAAFLIDGSMADALLGALDRHSRPLVQIAAMRALGRLKHAPAILPLVQRLSEPALCPHAIEALADLGDVNAITHLRPLLDDKSNAWRTDSASPMLRVCDVAKAAIDRLTPPPPPQETTAPEPEPQPQAQIDDAPEPRRNTLLYAPLIAALSVPLWIAGLLFATLVTVGKFETGDQQLQVLDMISPAPAVLGLLLGLTALVRGAPRTAWQSIAFFVGMALCGFAAYSLGSTVFPPLALP
ncbi:MAG: HEAT repeat domain-containing protein [Alphaproteobacteria bacterium]|nr:HEAT repeat domain-containing protein [Alphaproteobacteria bacterium]